MKHLVDFINEQLATEELDIAAKMAERKKYIRGNVMVIHRDMMDEPPANIIKQLPKYIAVDKIEKNSYTEFEQNKYGGTWEYRLCPEVQSLYHWFGNQPIEWLEREDVKKFEKEFKSALTPAGQRKKWKFEMEDDKYSRNKYGKRIKIFLQDGSDWVEIARIGV